MNLHADSLIGQARHKGAVCGLIGEKMHEISCGVCAKVGGIRFHPSQSPTGPVLSLRNVPRFIFREAPTARRRSILMP